MHPTVKPVALVADAILDCSDRGDIVLDPFGGSGTTLIAARAHRPGRRLGIELDPALLRCDPAGASQAQKWPAGPATPARKASPSGLAMACARPTPRPVEAAEDGIEEDQAPRGRAT